LRQLIDIRKILSNEEIPCLIIGNTTNLLFTDEDINAVVIHIGSLFSDVKIDGDKITAQAGLWVPRLARRAMQAGLTGLEHTCGIPGTLGGLVVMNGGSQRKGIGESITYVKTIDKEGNDKLYNAEECEFCYRGSIFQRLDETIVEVGLELIRAKNKNAVRAEMLKILRARNKKFPRKLPNCGSVFVSNPLMYEKFGSPGRIIEECGLKGLICGGAQISPVHSNFIVNNGGATTRDILSLVDKIKVIVFERTGHLMEVEARYVTAAGYIQEIR